MEVGAVVQANPGAFHDGFGVGGGVYVLVSIKLFSDAWAGVPAWYRARYLCLAPTAADPPEHEAGDMCVLTGPLSYMSGIFTPLIV
jgi:hypothetical protein